ncbi:MAG: HNH endonuclease [Gammaproteobacteria bacterium]|nr:MAG: HNH endonuclease [Gammaproteobacteria bacterium]
MTVPGNLRRLVIERAQARCEYCGLAQAGQEAAFHIDHVVPVAAGGETSVDNLALACVSCSLRKGARQRAPDPMTGQDQDLFNPRRERWSRHFSWNGTAIDPTTPTGRCTTEALKLNRPMALAIRLEEQLRGRHPPPDQPADEDERT